MSANLILRLIFAYFSILLHLLPKKLRLRLHLLLSSSPQLPPTPVAMDATADLTRVFQMFDHNGDGRITLDELTTSLRNMGIAIADRELDDMIQKIDVNGDGCVDLEEFCVLYRSIMEEGTDGEAADEEKEMEEAFKVFDQNGDGFITVEELKAVLGMLGLGQGSAEEECRRMIGRVDVDGDGRVSFEEFKQMMRSAGFNPTLSNRI